MRDILQSQHGCQEQARLYPWYDSAWLASYTKARGIIQQTRPTELATFVDAFRVLETRADFRVQFIGRLFDDATIGKVKRVAASLRREDLELHEARKFRRFVVHDNSLLTELQHEITPLVGELVGEAVEVSYNFVSLYGSMGICPVHLDAPNAKWTVDLCLNQSAPWPIHISDVRPWSDAESKSWPAEGWENVIKQSPMVRFAPYTLQPGQAIVFSGSSQWHYRDAMPRTGRQEFCNLVFFHFIPRGTSDLVRPAKWATLFGISELHEVA